MDNLTAGNPVAHRVRVYYTGSDALNEGEPLCYSFKTTKNWWGGSVSDAGVVTASDSTSEGNHNASKYMSVESPMRISLSSDTPASGSKTITGTTTDFDALQVGMFVSIAGTDVTNGNYEITAISRSTESGVTNSTITLDMDDATSTTADVSTKIDNISAFAGVVAKGGWVGRAGPRVIDIYVPNGAVVPVRSDQNCVLGRTILAVNSNEQHLTSPLSSYARPVAIAWETVDTATTTGLVLAKLDPNIFIYQKGDNAALLVDDEDTGNVVVNRIDTTFSQASGWCQALSITSAVTASTTNQTGVYVGFTHSGTGAGGFHTMQVRGNAYGTAVVGDINGVFSQITMRAGTAVSSAGIVAGIFAKVHVLTGGGTVAGNVVAGRFSLGLDANIAGKTAMFSFDSSSVGGAPVDYWFITKGTQHPGEDIGFATSTQGTNQYGAIKIRLGGISADKWIPVYDTVGCGA